MTVAPVGFAVGPRTNAAAPGARTAVGFEVSEQAAAINERPINDTDVVTARGEKRLRIELSEVGERDGSRGGQRRLPSSQNALHVGR
jgi:hypothetical protein